MNKYVEKFRAAVREYLTEAACTGKSEKTIGNYERRLRYFADFWESTEPDADPGRDDVRAWRDHLLASGMKPSTVKQYMIELNTFYSFAVEDEIYEFSPVVKRLMPKIKEQGKQYEKILDAESLAKLWENTGKGHFWARNYAIITMLLDGKVRNAELLDMRLKDIDFKYNEVTIPKGKGNKSRVVSLSDISVSAVKLYLSSGLRPSSCSDNDILFGTMAGGYWHRGTSAWLSALVERHVRAVTGLKGFRTHSLRHNGSMFDLNTGCSMERLQAELGHSSVTTTEIYAGRLGSKRNQAGFRVAICSRDYWAEKNKSQLEKMCVA